MRKFELLTTLVLVATLVPVALSQSTCFSCTNCATVDGLTATTCPAGTVGCFRSEATGQIIPSLYYYSPQIILSSSPQMAPCPVAVPLRSPRPTWKPAQSAPLANSALATLVTPERTLRVATAVTDMPRIVNGSSRPT